MPSGADLTMACVPITPPAPGWFSTTTGCPSAFETAGLVARVIVSTPEPVAIGQDEAHGPIRLREDGCGDRPAAPAARAASGEQCIAA